MKKIVSSLLIAGLLVSVSNTFAESAVRIDGASPGEWTMDFDAAKAVAAEKKLPLLLDFSGSDWCGWCKLMEEKVFQKDEWSAYATNSIMMVLLDFPGDKTLVPEKYVERNDALKDKYSVRGFPTFIILDANAETVMGRLSAGQDKTPASFIGELRKLFMFRDAEVAEYTKNLSKKDADKYKEIVEDLNSSKKKIAENEKAIADANKAIETLEDKIAEQENRATEFRASMLGEEKLKEYKKLILEQEAAEKKLSDWLETKPDRSEENQKLFKEMSAELSRIKAELSKF